MGGVGGMISLVKKIPQLLWMLILKQLQELMLRLVPKSIAFSIGGIAFCNENEFIKSSFPPLLQFFHRGDSVLAIYELSSSPSTI
jgi:hypothetical protein